MEDSIVALLQGAGKKTKTIHNVEHAKQPFPLAKSELAASAKEKTKRQRKHKKSGALTKKERSEIVQRIFADPCRVEQVLRMDCQQFDEGDLVGICKSIHVLANAKLSAAADSFVQQIGEQPLTVAQLQQVYAFGLVFSHKQ